MIENISSTVKSSGSWTYFIIKSIRNPTFQSQDNFTINSYYDYSNSQSLLVASMEGTINYTLNPPARDALETAISVPDNDVSTLTSYKLTYRLGSDLQTNQSIFYITPPLP
jgi:hypothetical protein